MFACNVAMLAADHYPDTVTEFQYELGPRKEIRISSTYMNNGELRHPWDLKG
jgi:hypothetical protein